MGLTLHSLILIAVALMVVIYVTTILPTQWLKVERLRQPIVGNKTILHISDMHLERIRVSPRKIQNLIREENPDMIALTGDYMDTSTTFPVLERYLKVFKDSGVPCFAVLGNHDYILSPAHVQWMMRLFKSYGIRLLVNESVVWEGFNVIGIDDYCTHHADEEKAYTSVDPNRPNLILTHDPNIVLALKKPYDYLLSGHFHGKQFNLPYLFHLFPMGPLPRKGIYKGRHHSDLGTYYISKGLGQSGYNARFLIRSEVTVHSV